MNELEQAALKGVSSLIADFCKSSIQMLAYRGKSEIEKIKITFEYGFKDYMERNIRKYSSIKTLLHRYQPIYIEDIYTSTSMSFGKISETEEDFVQTLLDRKNIVITGMAGSGKSMLMKHLFVRFCRDGIGLIPIFVELRSVSAQLKPNLVSYISDQIAIVIKDFSPAQLDFGLQGGKFVVLLDGLDEIDSDNRDSFSKEIIEFCFKYNNTPVIISSRPDDRFRSWNEFYIGEIDPLNIDDVKALVSKIDYDEDIKRSFILDVEQKLYDSHKSFLSNPLLCTMMLMTFTEFAEIPNKMHIFYSRAFEVLFDRHDRMKPSFRRKFYTNLPIDEFSYVLSIFSANSFFNQQFVFSFNDAVKVAKTALAFAGKENSPRDYVMDLSESISFLLLEGDELSFIHRSFQEYFTALFLAERNFTGIDTLIDRIAYTRANDQVIPLLYQINNEALESKYLNRRLDNLINEIASIDILKNPAKFFKLFYLGYMLDEENQIQFLVGRSSYKKSERADYYGLLVVLESCYFQSETLHLNGSNFDWSKIREKHKHTESGDFQFQVENPKDFDLIGTPVQAYLIENKQRIENIRNQISKVSEERKIFFDKIVLQGKSLQ